MLWVESYEYIELECKAKKDVHFFRSLNPSGLKAKQFVQNAMRY